MKSEKNNNCAPYKIGEVHTYEINIPAQVSKEEIVKIIDDFISNTDAYTGELTLKNVRKGANDNSELFIATFNHTIMPNEPYDSLENTLQNKLTDAVWTRKREIDKENNVEPEVVNEPISFSSDMMGGSGLGAMLSGLSGKSIPGLDPEKQAKLAETLEDIDNSYWDNHIHYNVLVEAVEDFDQAVVKRIGKLIKISSTDDFDVEVRNILTTFKGFFTIAGKTNWMAIRDFLADLRLSMKNELQQFCGYKRIDRSDENKSRDVAPHMRIVQEELYKKIEYAFDPYPSEYNIHL